MLPVVPAGTQLDGRVSDDVPMPRNGDLAVSLMLCGSCL